MKDAKKAGGLALAIMVISALILAVIVWTVNRNDRPGPVPQVITGGGGGGGAPTGAEYIVSSLDPTLTDEDVLTGTANQITVTNGVGTSTLSLPQDIATTSNVQFNDITAADQIFIGLGTGEIIDISGAATIDVATRDSVRILLDTNANSASTLSVLANGATTVFTVDESGNVTAANSFEIEEGVDTLTITVPVLTADRAVTFADLAGEVVLDTNIYEQHQWRYVPSLGNEDNLTPGGAIVGDSTPALVADRLYYSPWYVYRDIDVTQIEIFVNTAGAASSVLRACLFEVNDSFQPTTLVQDFGTFAVDTTGVKQITGFGTISLTAREGLYLMMVGSDGAPNLREIQYRPIGPNSGNHSSSGQPARGYHFIESQNTEITTGCSSDGVDWNDSRANTIFESSFAWIDTWTNAGPAAP